MNKSTYKFRDLNSNSDRYCEAFSVWHLAAKVDFRDIEDLQIETRDGFVPCFGGESIQKFLDRMSSADSHRSKITAEGLCGERIPHAGTYECLVAAA